MALSLNRIPSIPAIAADWYDLNKEAAGEYALSQFQDVPKTFLDYVRRNIPIYYSQWLALLPTNPNLHFTDFLRPDLFTQDWLSSSPFERGERPQIFAPTFRYIPF
jgi:hypothetical protein